MPVTAQDLITSIQKELQDTDGVFSTSDFLLRTLHDAVSLFSLAKGLQQEGVDVPLTPGVADYYPLLTYPRWILPIRVAIAGRPLRPTTLASLTRLSPTWLTDCEEEPEEFTQMGCSVLLIHPSPLSPVTARVTALMVPPDLALSAPTTLAVHLADALRLYVQAVALARESQYTRAAEKLKEVTDLLGLMSKRDTRFSADSKQRPAQTIDSPTREA